MAARKKKRRKKSSKKKSKKRAHKGKRPLSLLVKNYNRLGRIIRSRGGKV